MVGEALPPLTARHCLDMTVTSAPSEGVFSHAGGLLWRTNLCYYYPYENESTFGHELNLD